MINGVKKVFSTALTFAMLTSVIPTVDVSAASEWIARENKVNLRVGIFGDTHVGMGSSDCLVSSIKAINELSGGKPDGYLGVGDIVWFDKGQLSSDEQIKKAEAYYDSAKKALDENVVKGAPVWQVMGNHEFPLSNTDANITKKSKEMFVEKFLTGTAQEKEDFSAEINGYSVIGASPSNYNDLKSAELEEWIMTEIDKAIAKDSTNTNADGGFDDGVIPNSKKPVFYINHHPIKGSRKYVYPFNPSRSEISDDGYTSQKFADYLKTRPQVVSLYGHCHTQQQASGTVFQDGSAIVGVPLGGGGDGFSATHESIKTWQTLYTNGQGMLLEVDKNNVVNLVKYDLTSKEYIGTPWTFDIPKIVADMTDSDPSNDFDHQLYSADKREADKLSVPQWKNGAEIKITNLESGMVKMHIDDSDVILTETPNQQDDVIAGWHVILKDYYGKIVLDVKYDSGFYKWNYPNSFETILEGLGYNNSYTLEVSPVTVLGVEGAAVVKEFTTSQETVSAEAERIEAEDYVKDSRSKLEYNPASGGFLNTIVQGELRPGAYGWILSENPSFEFKYVPKKNGTYDVEYVMGKNNGGGNISTVTVSVDNTVLGTNLETGDEDMSMTGYNEDNQQKGGYAWNPYVQMKKYKKTIELEKDREYTVKFDIGACQGRSNLYLYAIDYIQFTPHNVDIPEGKEIKNLLRDENGKKLDDVSVSVADAYGTVTEAYGNGYGGKPEYAIDGNLSTTWFPNFGHEYPYFQIDLGKPQNISKVIYNGWRGDSGVYWTKYIQIQVSNYSDFRTYKVIKKTGSEGLDLNNTYEMALDPNVNKYRYVRFIKGGGTNWAAYSISELDVYGYEGDDTSIKENMVESIANVKDGDIGLTNVKNVWVSNPWGGDCVSRYTYNYGKPIEIKFANTVDMSSVNVNSVQLSKFDGANLNKVAYSADLDKENRTLKIELSQLDSFVGTHNNTKSQYYRIDITSAVQNADGSVTNVPQTIKFTTHQIAKAPYVEGKEIFNAAAGKSARYEHNQAWGSGIVDTDLSTANNAGLIGIYTNQFTNGGIAKDSTADNTKFTGTTELPLRYHTLVENNSLLIDLGADYDVAALSSVVMETAYHYYNVDHYLLSEPTYDVSGLTSVWNSGRNNAWEKGKAVSQKARYLLVNVASGEAFPWEIMVYTYIDKDNANDVYFTSPVSFASDGKTEIVTVTANASMAGENMLVIAEYNSSDVLQKMQYVKCENGKGKISYTKSDNMKYKLFLWNSINGLKPIKEAVTF